MKPVIILGCGGHAKVLTGMLKRLEINIIGFVAPEWPNVSEYLGFPIIGNDKAVLEYSVDAIELVNGVGSLPNDAGLRTRLFDYFQGFGYFFKTIVDPLAVIAEDVQLDQGVQIMTGVIVQAGAKIACNSIVNTGAIIEHDCRIGKHVHVAPGVVTSGNVLVGDQVHVGTGAIIIQGIEIGDYSVIGAGCVVTKSVGCRQILYPPRGLSQDL